ncbi:MAG: hypothetical protein U0Z17_00130 [Bacteroidales bacterium]
MADGFEFCTWLVGLVAERKKEKVNKSIMFLPGLLPGLIVEGKFPESEILKFLPGLSFALFQNIQAI